MNSSLFPSNKVFSVTELNGIIKEMLEGAFPQFILEGEISGFKRNSSGHLYFSLKDNDSLISAVMFKFSAAYLDFIPKDGMKVQCTGKLSVYPPQGKYQIVVSKMKIAGEGDILKLLEERKRRLFQEGLFNEDHKKPLPLLPKTIGVVTSPTGAALRDILQITRRRNKTVNVVIFPSMVQGDGASLSIAKQIQNANKAKLCDVLIVGRGGGSLEDLLPFSDECVIRAIYESEIPVVSAVGHEIDWALSDYAADKRAPTPSAAAELCVPELSAIFQELERCKSELYSTISQRVERIKLNIRNFDPENLELKFRAIEQPLLMRFDSAKEDLLTAMELHIKDTRQFIQNCITVLENRSPQSILDRGYSMVRVKDSGKIIRTGSDVTSGETIEIIPAKGKITAKVEKAE